MANTKKPTPRKPAVSRNPSTSGKTPMPKVVGAKPGTKKLMANTTKKVKVEGPTNYTKNVRYKLPMTPAQDRAFGKLQRSPKTNDTLFTTPKGTAKLPQKEIDAMQARRIADRKRTLARAESIIRRTK
jgi:phage/plasmid primase-like uncharacterized protein